MSSPLQIQLETNAADIVRRLDAFPPAMAQAVAQAMDRENELTVGQIQLTKLSKRGPRTLGVRTNRLRSSVRPSKAIVTGTTVESSIGSNVVYAGVHEYGLHASLRVRAHTRKAVKYAGGRKTIAQMDARGRIKRIKQKPVSSQVVQVRSHWRTVNVPERAYIRTTIAERSAHYAAAMSNAILSTWGGAS